MKTMGNVTMERYILEFTMEIKLWKSNLPDLSENYGNILDLW